MQMECNHITGKKEYTMVQTYIKLQQYNVGLAINNNSPVYTI